MQSAIETAAAQPVWNVTMFTHLLARKTKIASKVQHGDNGGRHHFCIRHLTLSIFPVVQGLEHIITQTKNDYNLSVHEFFLYVEVGIPQLYRKLMDFSFPATLGGNLG